MNSTLNRSLFLQVHVVLCSNNETNNKLSRTPAADAIWFKEVCVAGEQVKVTFMKNNGKNSSRDANKIWLKQNLLT